MITDDEEETLDQDIQHPEPETIQHEGVTNEERTSPLQIGFNDTQHDVLDEHPTFWMMYRNICIGIIDLTMHQM